jgi:transcriptional regulator with XRE-family HTH domain
VKINGTHLYKESKTDFGRALRRIRERHGVSQSVLARSTEPPVNHSTISRFEIGSRNPNRKTVEAIADALGASEWERSELLLTAGYTSDLTEEVISHPLVLELGHLLEDGGIDPQIRADVEGVLKLALLGAGVIIGDR